VVNPDPVIVQERTTLFRTSLEKWKTHLERAEKAYKHYMDQKKTSLSGASPTVLNLSIDAMELIQLPCFQTFQPKVWFAFFSVTTRNQKRTLFGYL